MLSDLITNMLKENAKDIGLIGGMVLLIRIVIWKIKQLTGVIFSEHPDRATSRRGRRRGHAASAPVKPVRNAAYYEGLKRGMTGTAGLSASERYHQKLQRKYKYGKGKNAISYAAGYREGVKQKEWNEYVRLVRQEQQDARLALARGRD